jgi:hypothetical protein
MISLMKLVDIAIGKVRASPAATSDPALVG